MKFVYIEDDLDDLERFCEAIQKINPSYECFAACDGTKGISMIDGIEKPDFIFIDMNLPGLSGKEVLMILRRDARFKTVPIIMTSVLLLASEVKDLRTYGATHCMKKPEHFGELCEQISTVITSHLVSH